MDRSVFGSILPLRCKSVVLVPLGVVNTPGCKVEFHAVSRLNVFPNVCMVSKYLDSSEPSNITTAFWIFSIFSW